MTRTVRIPSLLSVCRFVFLALAVNLQIQPALAGSGGELTIHVIDAKSGLPTSARMHLKSQRGKPVRPKGSVYWHDHFVIDGSITLELRRGHYVFELERGLEYKTFQGHFEIKHHAEDEETIELVRFADLASEGWYAGDLHIHRKPKQIELLMRTEGLHVAPVISWWNAMGKYQSLGVTQQGPKRSNDNRYYDVRAGEDEREGGALLYFQLERPLGLAKANRYFPPSSQFLVEAKNQANVHVDAEKPFSWDYPIWLASGRIDSVGVLNNHLWRDGGVDDEDWGKPRDRVLYPAPHGNGRWSESIYYHTLNAGLRIPPSAGSGSGVLPNPVGYNRVYVHCGSQLNYESWWENLRAGRVFVTNGPLLRTSVEGHPPGHLFTATDGEKLELLVGLTLSTRERIEYLEIIKDGRAVHHVRLDQFAKAGGQLPPVVFDESGWFLVRAVTTNQDTYRYASTGPYYVEFDEKPRISRESAEFFLSWVEELARIKLPRDESERGETMRYLRSARKFWQERADSANAE